MNIRHHQSVPPLPPWRPVPPEYPWPPEHPAPQPTPSQPARVWTDRGQWPAVLYDRLLDQRIVIAHGLLDDDAATRLCAQLLTLDAESSQPIRLELQSLDAELPAALTVIGVLDVLRAPVCAYAGGYLRGPALGVLAAAGRRYAYASALFVLAEPQTHVDGTAADVQSHEQQLSTMMGELASRLAQATGRDRDEIRSDFEQQRLLNVDDAIEYGLIQQRAEPRRPFRTGLSPDE
jgi:ATP-dependent Clp protease protease subunit